MVKQIAVLMVLACAPQLHGTPQATNQQDPSGAPPSSVESQSSSASQTSKSKSKSKSRRSKLNHKKKSLASLSLEQLGRIEVTTVSKEPEEVRRTPAAIYVLTQNEIRRSGARTIMDALRLVPGVQVARIDSDHWAIGIRGFGSAFSKSLLVMIDGRSVYSPLFAGVYWDVQNVMLENVDRIEVIRGPGGTIWGPNAVQGVINIITKKASETHGLLATTTAGGVDHTDNAVRWGSGNGKGFDYRVYGSGFARGSEKVPDPLYSDAWHHAQAGFRADWDKGGPDTFTIQGDAYNGRDGYTVAIATINPPAQNTVNGTEDVGGGNLLFHWTHLINQGSDIQLRAYFDRTTRLGPQTGEDRNTFDVDFLHHLTLPGRQNFLWGLGARISPSDFSSACRQSTFCRTTSRTSFTPASSRTRFRSIAKIWC